MSDQSAIEWTEATWNPVRGCTKVSPGCKHCYAETFAERFRGVPGHPFEQGFDLRLVPEALDLPRRWRRGRLVFVNSMSDLFQEDVPDEFIQKVFQVMRECPQHQFQVLTKRAERLAELAPHLHWAPNIWMGVSVENADYTWRVANSSGPRGDPVSQRRATTRTDRAATASGNSLGHRWRRKRAQGTRDEGRMGPIDSGPMSRRGCFVLL